jgi:hypothetical protein
MTIANNQVVEQQLCFKKRRCFPLYSPSTLIHAHLKSPLPSKNIQVAADCKLQTNLVPSF